MSSIYGRNYFIKIKIEKLGSGSMMSVSAGYTLVNASRLATVFGWADGKTSLLSGRTEGRRERDARK